MTKYRYKDEPGCVITEVNVWHAGDGTLREVVTSVDTIRFTNDGLLVDDMLGFVHFISDDDYVFNHPTIFGKIVVINSDDFHATFEESR